MILAPTRTLTPVARRRSTARRDPTRPTEGNRPTAAQVSSVLGSQPHSLTPTPERRAGDDCAGFEEMPASRRLDLVLRLGRVSGGSGLRLTLASGSCAAWRIVKIR